MLPSGHHPHIPTLWSTPCITASKGGPYVWPPDYTGPAVILQGKDGLSHHWYRFFGYGVGKVNLSLAFHCYLHGKKLQEGNRWP
jgi:hypothetical protein